MKIPAAETALTRRSIVKGAGTLAIGVVAPSILHLGTAFAAFPDRPIKIVVANTPGGPSDIIARFMAAWMQEAKIGRASCRERV